MLDLSGEQIVILSTDSKVREILAVSKRAAGNLVWRDLMSKS
jgi:hypothetical protein